MKKLCLLAILALALIVTTVACTGGEEPADTTAPTDAVTEDATNAATDDADEETTEAEAEETTSAVTEEETPAVTEEATQSPAVTDPEEPTETEPATEPETEPQETEIVEGVIIREDFNGTLADVDKSFSLEVADKLTFEDGWICGTWSQGRCIRYLNEVRYYAFETRLITGGWHPDKPNTGFAYRTAIGLRIPFDLTTGQAAVFEPDNGDPDGTSYLGATGIFLYPYGNSIEVAIHVKDPSRIRKATSVGYTFTLPESVSFDEGATVRYEDKGNTVTIYVEGELVATVKLSDKGYDDGQSWKAETYRYAEILDAEGNVVLTTEGHTAYVAVEGNCAIFERANSFKIDYIELYQFKYDPTAPSYDDWNGVEGKFMTDKSTYEVGEAIRFVTWMAEGQTESWFELPAAKNPEGINKYFYVNNPAVSDSSADAESGKVYDLKELFAGLGTFTTPGTYTFVWYPTGGYDDPIEVSFTIVSEGSEDEGDDEPAAPTYNGVELFHIDKTEYVVGEPIMVTFGDLPAGAQFNIKHPTAPQGGGWAWCLVDGSNASYGLNKNVLPRPNSSGDLTQVVQGTFAIVPGEYTVVVNKTGTSLDDVWITFTVVAGE